MLYIQLVIFNLSIITYLIYSSILSSFIALIKKVLAKDIWINKSQSNKRLRINKAPKR